MKFKFDLILLKLESFFMISLIQMLKMTPLRGRERERKEREPQRQMNRYRFLSFL